MKYSKKSFVILGLIILVGILVGAIRYWTVVVETPTPNGGVGSTDGMPVQQMPSASTSLSLSADEKSISVDGNVLLVVDNDTIFNWFKTTSQLCDEFNILSSPDRRMFCENKAFFKSQTRFASISLSPNAMKVGFTIESDALNPDRVVGIFSRTTNTVNLFGSYYIGNEFIGFSPKGMNFVYRGGCFEGMCALYVKDSETFIDKITLSDSEFADGRTADATFVRWISDNEIEYKLGSQLKRATF